MKIILSPAKKMITDTDSIEPVALPGFIDKTSSYLMIDILRLHFVSYPKINWQQKVSMPGWLVVKWSDSKYVLEHKTE